MTARSATTELTTRQSLAFLREQPFGRMAVVLDGKPDIFPINFVVHLETPTKAVVYIRTSPGTKLFATVGGFPIALEADEVGDETATSVVVYGHGRLVQHRHEFERIQTLGLEPWVAERKAEVVAIDVERVSGRQFVLGPAPRGIAAFPAD